ncbi:MAG: hypothetical protein U0176_20360 [Bacteroidia bacterium]
MKTLVSIRLLLLLGVVLGCLGLHGQSTVTLRFFDGGVPVSNAQVSVEQGGVALGNGFTDANGRVMISVPYLRGPSIDVNGTQYSGNTSRTWNLLGFVTLDARNSADVHLDQALSRSFPTTASRLPNSSGNNFASNWPPTTTNSLTVPSINWADPAALLQQLQSNQPTTYSISPSTTTTPSARSTQPTGTYNLGAFSNPPATTNSNPSLGGIDLNQILAYNNATLSPTDLAGLQNAINAMNSAGLGNSLNGYSIYMPNNNGSNTILTIPGNQPTTTFTMPSTGTHNVGKVGTKTLTRADDDSTAAVKPTTKSDSTQPKAVTPSTKPRAKVHFKSETGEPITVFLDDNQVNPSPTTDVVAQLPISYGLHPVVRVEFQKKGIPAVEKTLTLSGTKAQYDFAVRKNARGEWVVE